MKTIHKLVPILLIIGMGCITNTEDLTIDPEDDGSETTVSYSTTIQPLLSTSCAGCHGSGSLNFSSYSTLVSSVGTNYGDKIIVAGDADASGLVDKIEPDPVHGERMPLNQTPFSTTQIQNIRNWINQGALNN